MTIGKVLARIWGYSTKSFTKAKGAKNVITDFIRQSKCSTTDLHTLNKMAKS